VLEGLQVVEVLRRLDQGDRLVVEVPDGVGQEVGPRHVVGVEHGDHVGVDDLEGVVQVAGLGVAAIGAPQVAGAEVGGELGDLRPGAVVEDPGVVVGLQRDRGRDGGGEHLGGLVPGGDQHRDAQRGLAGGACPRPGPEVPQREGVQAEPDRGVQLQQVRR
jgi:hypothetical protein